MFNEQKDKTLVSEAEIKSMLQTESLTEKELQEIQLTLDVLAEVLYKTLIK